MNRAPPAEFSLGELLLEIETWPKSPAGQTVLPILIGWLQLLNSPPPSHCEKEPIRETP